jgi:hypothetical protein
VGAFGSVIPTPLAYQWFKNGSPIANATDTAYSISALALSDAGNYFVHVTNSVGSTNSRTVGLGVLAAPVSPPAIPGLVLHLPFDNNLLDATGRGNNGAARGAPTFVPDGMLGQGLHYFTDINTTNAGSTYFVTSANYVTLGVRPDLFFGANIDFSVSMWVRLPLNYTGGDLPFFTDTTNSTFGPGFVFAPSYGSTGQPAPTTPWNGSWAFSLYNNAASAGIGVYGQPIGSINDGNWHHLVHVFDREQGNVNYVDGILAGYAVQGGTSIIDAGNVDLPQPAPANIGQDAAGAYTSGGDNFSPGPGALESSADIDDLGVWHKALTPLEAASIYMAAISNHLSFTGTATLPGLSVIHSGQNVILTWSMGALQAADNVTGPYVDVLGATTPDVSPLTVPASAARKFYRIRGQ